MNIQDGNSGFFFYIYFSAMQKFINYLLRRTYHFSSYLFLTSWNLCPTEKEHCNATDLPEICYGLCFIQYYPDGKRDVYTAFCKWLVHWKKEVIGKTENQIHWDSHNWTEEGSRGPMSVQFQLLDFIRVIFRLH